LKINVTASFNQLLRDGSMPIFPAATKSGVVQNKNGDTLLIIAAHKGHAAVAQLLLAVGCNIDVQTKDGETALQAAQRVGHAAIATLIQNTKHRTHSTNVVLGR
jgi:ankyrin repeat protein